MAHTGRCFCGQVRYRIAAEPLLAVSCWCRDCQYIAAGSATHNVIFPDEAVSFEGEVATIEKTADSGRRVERGFCPKCGSQIYSRSLDPGGIPMRIRAGTLDDRELLAPQAAIFTASAPSWATIAPDVPHFDKAAPPEAIREAMAGARPESED